MRRVAILGRDGAWLSLCPGLERSGAVLVRAAVVRRDRADRAGGDRRPVLAARNRARRRGGPHRRPAELDLAAAAAVDDDRGVDAARLARGARQSRRFGQSDRRRRAVVAGPQHAFLRHVFAGAAAERAGAQPSRGVSRDGAVAPSAFAFPLARGGAGRGARQGRRPLFGPRARARIVPCVQSRAGRAGAFERAGRRRHGAPCRACAVVRDRRVDLALRAGAAVRPARRQPRDGAANVRRRRGGDPIQPRPPAAGARSRAPGRHRVRRQPDAAQLEPRLHRSLRHSARRAHDRPRARRADPLQRPARRLWPGAERGFRLAAAGELVERRRDAAAAASILRCASSRRARRGCRTAASSPPTPTSATPSPRKRSLAASTSCWSGACRSAPPRSSASTKSLPRRKPRPKKPTSRKPASSPPPATTSCSRSTPRGCTPAPWARLWRGSTTRRNWRATSIPRSRRSRRFSAPCSTCRGSTPARSSLCSPTSRCKTCFGN